MIVSRPSPKVALPTEKDLIIGHKEAQKTQVKLAAKSYQS